MARYLYHWTPAINVESILRDGLDPEYATGKLPVVWMADDRMYLWGCAHAAMHQMCSPDKMVLLRVRVDGLRLRRTRWTGVETSPVKIAPSRIRVCTVAIRATVTKRRKR